MGKGYCEVCGKEFSNIWQHQQTKSHKDAVKASKEGNDTKKKDEPKKVKQETGKGSKNRKNNNSGYCDICERQYANIAEHRKSKKHLKKVKELEDEKSTVNNKQGQDTPPQAYENQNSSNQDAETGGEVENITREYAIQIIDSANEKSEKSVPEKSGAEKVADFFFSEQMAPITTSILEALALALQGRANNQTQQGNVVKTISGQEFVCDPRF